MFAIGTRSRAPTSLSARQFIEWGINGTRLECLACLNLLTTLPPICAGLVRNILWRRFGLSLFETFFYILVKI